MDPESFRNQWFSKKLVITFCVDLYIFFTSTLQHCVSIVSAHVPSVPIWHLWYFILVEYKSTVWRFSSHRSFSYGELFYLRGRLIEITLVSFNPWPRMQLERRVVLIETVRGDHGLIVESLLWNQGQRCRGRDERMGQSPSFPLYGQRACTRSKKRKKENKKERERGNSWKWNIEKATWQKENREGDDRCSLVRGWLNRSRAIMDDAARARREIELLRLRSEILSGRCARSVVKRALNPVVWTFGTRGQRWKRMEKQVENIFSCKRWELINPLLPR